MPTHGFRPIKKKTSDVRDKQNLLWINTATLLATMTTPITVTFDAKHDLQLDAYLPDTSDKVNGRALSVPVIIHYHRGGMLIGSKSDIYPPFMPGEYAYLSYSALQEIHKDTQSIFNLGKSYSSPPTTDYFSRPLQMI